MIFMSGQIEHAKISGHCGYGLSLCLVNSLSAECSELESCEWSWELIARERERQRCLCTPSPVPPTPPSKSLSFTNTPVSFLLTRDPRERWTFLFLCKFAV